jgi:hypothetical protein
MLRVALLFLLALLPASGRCGAETLYATVLGNPKYVVGSSTLHSGLFASRDGGRSWEHLGPENLKAYSMDGVDASGGKILYIAAGNGVHRSTDAGTTWRIVTDWRMTEVLDVKVDQRHPQRVFAATAYGFWRSSDGGDTWEHPSDTPLAQGYIYRLDYRSDGRMVVLGEHSVAEYDPASGFGVYSGEEKIPAPRALVELPPLGTIVSTTRKPGMIRLAWLRSSDPFSSRTLPRSSTPEAGRLARALEASPSTDIYDLLIPASTKSEPDGTIYAAGDSGVWRIDMSFRTPWSDISEGLPNRIVHAIAWLPSSGTLMAGSFDGVFRREGTEWKQAGLEGSQIWRLVVKPW